LKAIDTVSVYSAPVKENRYSRQILLSEIGREGQRMMGSSAPFPCSLLEDLS
jgi:hypothetical protein